MKEQLFKNLDCPRKRYVSMIEKPAMVSPAIILKRLQESLGLLFSWRFDSQYPHVSTHHQLSRENQTLEIKESRNGVWHLLISVKYT